MLTFSDYQRINGHRSMTSARRERAHNIYEQTFNEDVGYRYCYIYDYDHDDQKNLSKGMTYKQTTKTGIEAKYYVTQYGSLSKDQVEYHIEFHRDQDSLPYYSDSFGVNAEFPIGLYIDIPDENNIYRKWLICSRDMEPDFVNYSVLPCNYNFHWIKDGKPFQMWGVARLRNSYNSGVWRDYKIQTVENQDQMFLPRNSISNLLFYDDRLVISDLLPEPIVWSITKVETIHPFGINKLTLAQDKFNHETDYVDRKTGEMYADYFKYPINSNHNDFELKFVGDNEIKIGGKSRLIKIHYLSENFDIDNLKWDFLINKQNVNNFIELSKIDNETASILFIGDESYIGDIMTIRATHNDHLSEIKVKISAL